MSKANKSITLPPTIMEVENGSLQDLFPLNQGSFPLNHDYGRKGNIAMKVPYTHSNGTTSIVTLSIHSNTIQKSMGTSRSCSCYLLVMQLKKHNTKLHHHNITQLQPKKNASQHHNRLIFSWCPLAPLDSPRPTPFPPDAVVRPIGGWESRGLEDLQVHRRRYVYHSPTSFEPKHLHGGGTRWNPVILEKEIHQLRIR